MTIEELLSQPEGPSLEFKRTLLDVIERRQAGGASPFVIAWPNGVSLRTNS